MPEEVIAEAVQGGTLVYLDVETQNLSKVQVLEELAKQLAAGGSAPLRICIPGVGSPVWGEGDLDAQVRF